ncbi:hypothetical protein [Enterococcus sp. DIV0240a]|uniref:hypothetical protein n=1 Tax=unclassified Enterococcus TaxID=2608891 RepID=UPI003D26EA84
MVKLDLTNQRFGRLTVIKETAERRRKCVVWECKCDCGKTTHRTSVELKYHGIRSCGCLRGPKRNNLEAEIVAKRRKLKTEKEYRFEYSKCKEPVIGRLVNEYQKTAAFEVLRTGCDADREALRQLNNRVVVSKKAVVAI